MIHRSSMIFVVKISQMIVRTEKVLISHPKGIYLWQFRCLELRLASSSPNWFIKDPSRSKTWNRQIIYLRKAVFSLNITIQAWSAFIACEMNKSIPTLTVEGLENGQTERRNTALRGVKIYDIMSCRIPACMIQVCIRNVAFFFFLTLKSWFVFLNTLQLNIRCLNVLYCILHCCRNESRSYSY